jgi:multiple sugar transport system substrate-binding protein
VPRGLKPAISYTFSNFLHNSGGHYMKAGRADLCGPVDKNAYELYSTLLRDYGPPGVVNYSFLQTAALYSAGLAAMAFESSGQMVFISKTPARPKDTGVMRNRTCGTRRKDAAWLFVRACLAERVVACVAR